MAAQQEILIGVCGGIAAYKSAAVVSKLVQLGHGVSVVMTENANQFIGPATFQALTGRRILQETFDLADHPLGPHIELARQADLFCIAPATANFMAKAAQGLADDLLSTLLLSVTAPVLMAPAMNTEMWEKAVVQRNVNQLREDGVVMIDPGEGWLSCRQKGAGRMAEPETIVEAIGQQLG